ENVTTKAIAKVAAVATGLAMATSMLSFAPMVHAALTDSQVQAILSLLQSFGADSTTIANVQASLTGSAPVTTGTGSSSAACVFTKDLTVGSTGSEVSQLQTALIAKGYMSGSATGYFGAITKAAVMKWQTAAGVSPAAGYFGAKSRAAFCGTASTGTTGGTVSAGTGNGLKVMVSPTSPNGSVLVAGQGIGDIADFTFSNPTSAPINVTGLTFKRIGVSNDSALSNVYLYNGATRITDSAGVSSSQFSYSDPTAIFTVPAGGVYTVSVRADIASGTSGSQIGASLVSVSSNGTLDSSVSFPVNSGYQTVSSATLASVVFNGTTLPSTNTSLTPANDVVVWQNTVAVSTNPVKLSSLRLTNLGSIDATNVINLRLYVDGTQVGSAVPTMGADRTVTFDLSAAPVSLSTQSHVIKVLANITGGSSRTLQLSVQRSSDAMFVDAQLNQPVLLNTTTAGTAFSAANSGVQTIAAVTASSGVSVSLDPSSPTANIATGASSVKFATFSMLASGENVKVQDLYVYASSTQSSGALAGVGGLNNGKIFVNGVQVGSTKDIGSLVAGVTDFALGSSLILPAGVTTKVDIYADAQDTAGTNLPNNSTVIVSLKAGSSNGQGMSSLVSTNVPASAVSTNSVTVSSSSLTATKYTGYGNQTLVSGSNNAKLGAFTLSTGSTEGVNVNTIVLTMSASNAASITNLTLKDDATGTQLGSIITTPSASNSFNVSYSVPASSTKTIDVYGNVLAGANAGTIVLTVDTSTTGTGLVTSVSTSPSATAGLQTITIAAAGTLTPTRGAGDPTSTNVIAGASSVNVGEFNFAAQNSSYTVNNLAILVPNGAATSVTNVTVTYKDANGATQTQTQALTTNASMAYATATFTGLGMYVPMNDSANLDVSVGIPTIASGATSGAAISVKLDTGNTAGVFSATDSAGNTTTKINSGTVVSSNGTFYVRKSIPTFAMITPSSTVPSTGSPIYKFSITADPAGAIEWSKLTFNIATVTASVSNVYLTDDSSGTNLLDNTTTSASTTATTITVDLTKNSSQPQYQQVAAGATKVYDLYGTVSSYGATGSTITISLAADSATVANGAASASGNTSWSDRSASGHTISTTDWTNGYLLKNFTSNALSYSK
ncbi:peptidoglycan-binding protein, partial [Patescibacteria group bacterium]|nr:peptidoglycan-binding protein [Patescibacteria group bacterium]